MPEPANTSDSFTPEEFALAAFCDVCDHSAAVHRATIPPGLAIPEVPARRLCASGVGGG
jgi:hypothetical protein